MTEHLNVNSEGVFVDKTVARTGVKNWEEFNVSCKYELHALPEYMDNGDLKLSFGVMDKFALFLKEKGWTNVTAKIAEGYDYEEVGKEHYRFTMVFGGGGENEKLTFSKHYSADVKDHGSVEGTARSTVGLLNGSTDDKKEAEEKLASIYIEKMEATYTDFENRWEEGVFVENQKI